MQVIWVDLLYLARGAGAGGEAGAGRPWRLWVKRQIRRTPPHTTPAAVADGVVAKVYSDDGVQWLRSSDVAF
jgi:hypothetical protein